METRDRGPSPVAEISSLGRPLDPDYPTNRAVLILAPIAGLVTGALAVAGAADVVTVLWRTAGGALAAFGVWALAREVAPEDEVVAAFLAMGLGLGAYLLLDAALLPVFAALVYARIVNRSTGVAATGFDSVLVTGVALLAAWRAGSPWPAAAGAAAFVLDAVLKPGHARQWLFAGACGAGAVGLTSAGLAPGVVPVQPGLLPRAIGTIVMVGTIALIAGTRSCDVRCDRTGEPISVARVRGAQGVTLLTALAWAAAGTRGVEAGALVWAVLAAAALGAAWRRFAPE